MFEFDPSIDGPTPEHVRWTLVHNCPLRAGTDVSDPDQTERLLRTVRYISDFSQWRFVIDNLAITKNVAETYFAFDTSKAAAPFGGFDEINQCCQECPANGGGAGWAGCFGTVALPTEPKSRARYMDFFDTPPMTPEGDEAVPRTVSNRWFFIWRELQSDDLSKRQAALRTLRIICAAIPDHYKELGLPVSVILGWRDLSGLFVALRHHPEMRVVLSAHPAGITSGRSWQVDPHCIQCKASWWNEKKQTCEICGHLGGRQPTRTRKRIGIRPFRPIEELVSAEEVPAVIDRLWAKYNEVKAESERQPLLSRVFSTLNSWLRSGRRG